MYVLIFKVSSCQESNLKIVSKLLNGLIRFQFSILGCLQTIGCVVCKWVVPNKGPKVLRNQFCQACLPKVSRPFLLFTWTSSALINAMSPHPRPWNEVKQTATRLKRNVENQDHRRFSSSHWIRSKKVTNVFSGQHHSQPINKDR